METNQTPRNEQERKVYTSPELVEYGYLADLTQTLVDNPNDGLGGTSPTTL
jgi:hypothetical protein